MLIKEPKKIIDGIKAFNPEISDSEDFNIDGIESLVRAEANQHFWNKSRAELINKYFCRFVDLNDKILEIGCGTGYIADKISESGYKNIALSDIHFQSFKYAKQLYGFKDLYQFSIFDPPFAEEFDVISLFDVIEHLDNDIEALKSVALMLKSGGKIILTIPAHQILWHRGDRVAGHKRRYNLSNINEAIKKAGFKRITSKYFFVTIFLPLLIRSFTQRDNGSKISSYEKEFESKVKINKISNYIFYKICQLENKIHRFMPNFFGGSIILVAQKND
jgi:2-polyprenyl-3-methyl-5-hydroxy-6-metoxy-1,4-benzoquinol methylase